MTFQKELTYKRITRVICDYLFISGNYVIIYFAAEPPHKMAKLLGVIILTFVWAFWRDRFDKRSIAYIPDETVDNGISSPRTDFSNHFDWIAFFYQVLTFMIAFLIGQWILNIFSDYSGLLIICGCTIIGASLLNINHSRNKYTIEGEMLHIKEYSLFRPLTEIHIPISDISAIRIKAPYAPARSQLVLTVGGVDRELRCMMTNIIPLAQALATRLP